MTAVPLCARIGRMAKKPAPQRDDPAQSKRFIDMAREVEADECDDALERAFAKIVPSKRRDHEK